MTDLSRLTKAEIINILEEKDKSLEEYKKKEEDLKKQVQADLSFKQTDKEAKTQEEAQARKDFIKRATRGRWTSEEKYQEWIKKTQRQRA